MSNPIDLPLDDDDRLAEPPLVDSLHYEREVDGFSIIFVPSVGEDPTHTIFIPRESPEGRQISAYLYRIQQLIGNRIRKNRPQWRRGLLCQTRQRRDYPPLEQNPHRAMGAGSIRPLETNRQRRRGGIQHPSRGTALVRIDVRSRLPSVGSALSPNAGPFSVESSLTPQSFFFFFAYNFGSLSPCYSRSLTTQPRA